MGWLALIAFVPLSQALTPTALFWLIAGGVFYTVGALIYHFRKILTAMPSGTCSS
jgi:hemolysin III